MKLVTVCAVLLVSAGVASANLLTNPGFETGDMTGWSAGFYNGTGQDAHSGLYGGAYAVPVGRASGDWYVMDQSVPVTAGLDYDASFWLRTAGTANNSESFLEIQWMDSGNNIMWINSYSSTHVTGIQDYTMYSITNCVAPVGAAKADVRAIVHTTGVTAGDTMYHTFDDFSFARPIPEPGTLALCLMGIGFGSIVMHRRRRNG